MRSELMIMTDFWPNVKSTRETESRPCGICSPYVASG